MYFLILFKRVFSYTPIFRSLSISAQVYIPEHAGSSSLLMKLHNLTTLINPLPPDLSFFQTAFQFSLANYKFGPPYN